MNSPAHPGDTATIWSTGLGASPGDDGSGPPQQIDMSNLPLTVYAGTQRATVTYRGRSGFTGEDQINFVVPSGITGCFAPIAVQIGNVVSNFVTMPIAPAGQSCPDPVLGLVSLNGRAPTGNVTLTRSTTIGTTTSTTESGQAFFGTPQLLASPPLPPVAGNLYNLPSGTCAGGVTFPGVFDLLVSPLDAGPALTITGPNGSQQLPQGNGFIPYTAQFGAGFLGAGVYTVSGTGGTDVHPFANVGPFSQNFTIPQPFAWTNQPDITTVDRSHGLDLTWTGGDPNSTVQITGDFATFICNAKSSDQHFTIPAFVLLSLPPSSGTSPSDLTLSTTSTTAFTASGIASGTINSMVTIKKNVTYR